MCWENVQKAATTLVSQLRKYCYPQFLDKLGLTSLKDRWVRGNVIEVYKLMSGKGQIDSRQFFRLGDNRYGLRGHELKIATDWTRGSSSSASKWSTVGINYWHT